MSQYLSATGRHAMITYTYGVYMSSLYGKTLLLDPLLPPKKCPLDCVTCPLGKTKRAKTDQVVRGPSPERLYRDVEENKPANLVPDTILIWGSGDPLLLAELGDLLEKLNVMIRERWIRARLVVHTSLTRSLPLDKLLEVVDSFVVPYLWYGDDKHILGWPIEMSFAAYTDVVKYIARLYKEKLMLELHVFKLGSQLLPTAEHLDETLVNISRIGIENIIVKPLDRPSAGHLVKPPPESRVKLLLDKLVEKGIDAKLETALPFNALLEWNRVIDRLYNQLLRLPLSYDEVRSIYGDIGVTALNNLVERKKVVRFHWGGKIYYRATL